MRNDAAANNRLSVAKREFRLLITFISMYVAFLLGAIPVLLSPIIYTFSYIVGSMFAITAITLFVMSSTISPIFTLKLRTDYKVTLFNSNNDRVPSAVMPLRSTTATSVSSSVPQQAMTPL